MTPYLLILFSFLGENTMVVAQERIVSTFIGSGLAFISSYVIFPSWEGEQIQKYMRGLLIANYQYFSKILETLINRNLTETDYKLARKQVYVATANMASAFQRMITEPKRKQKNSKGLHKFVVFNHLFTSHTANLISSVRSLESSEISGEPIRNLKRVLVKLEKLIRAYDNEEDNNDFETVKFSIPETLLTDGNDGPEKTFINGQVFELKKICDDLRKSTESVLPNLKNLT